MSLVVFLDTGVLGLITHPQAGATATGCVNWLLGLLGTGARICVPEICDYELRREYLRRNSTAALARLDQLNRSIEYVAINTQTMNHAATLWADARNSGHVTADPQALDGNVILAAQAQLFASPDDQVIVATTNVGHLAHFVAASTWQAISA